jgi:CubicO group peptidase (beta-lactamase class C family)
MERVQHASPVIRPANFWMRGFGYADLENRVPATPDTTFGSTLGMQLVEKGRLTLEAPIAKDTPSRDAPAITDERVQIRHILSHTSEGTPGDRFAYNGSRRYAPSLGRFADLLTRLVILAAAPGRASPLSCTRQAARTVRPRSGSPGRPSLSSPWSSSSSARQRRCRYAS